METTNRTNQLHSANNSNLFALDLSSSSSDEDEDDIGKITESQTESVKMSTDSKKCQECGLSFDLYQTLQLHILNVHRIEGPGGGPGAASFNSSEEEYVESEEGAGTDTDEPVNVVSCDPDEVPDPKPFKCTQCTKCFMIAKHLEMHMQVHELKQKTEAAYRKAAAVRGGTYECRFCHAVQRSASGLRAHERRHLKSSQTAEKLKIPPKKRRGRSSRAAATRATESNRIRACEDDDKDSDAKESDEWSNED